MREGLQAAVGYGITRYAHEPSPQLRCPAIGCCAVKCRSRWSDGF